MANGFSVLTVRAATAWLAGSSKILHAPDSVRELLGDLLVLMRPYGVRRIYTGEPRWYHLTPPAVDQLVDGMCIGRVKTLVIRSEPGLISVVEASGVVQLPRSITVEPIRIDFTINPRSVDGQRDALLLLTRFITRWFPMLAAASAFVSTQGIRDGRWIGDSPTQTALEVRRATLIPPNWEALTRYARGAFWGNGLGPDLCNRLGGRDQVLREAPVDIAQPLGDGAWLQFSRYPPGEDRLRALETYLALLLDWDASTVQGLLGAFEERGTPADQERVTSAPRRAPDESSGPRRRVKLRVLGDLEIDVGLNVYLAEPPSPEQQARVKAVVDDWYQEGLYGGFGGAGLHDLRGPSVDGQVMRWYADLGSANGRRAIRELVRRLEGISDIVVDRLVVGVEEVR